MQYRRKMNAWGERVGYQGCPVPKHPLNNVPYVWEPPFTFAQPNSSWSEDDKKKVIDLLTEHRWTPDQWNPFRHPDEEYFNWLPSMAPTQKSALKKTKKDKPNHHSSHAKDFVKLNKPRERTPMPIRFYRDASGRECMYICIDDEK